uniref:Uncharacterized protein n=1 Tax=Panagrolaimus sp. JU765 TaxID=591449 RepID=A0AC34Q350_9BILA
MKKSHEFLDQIEDVEKYIPEILSKLGDSNGFLDLQFVNFTQTYPIINATQRFISVFNNFNEMFGIRTNGFFEEYLQNLVNEYVPISTFHFAMEFNQPMEFLASESLDFHTVDKRIIKLRHQCGYIELSVQPVENHDTLLSIPMKDKRFKFFVYYKNDTNSSNDLPQLNMKSLITALRNPKPSSYESIILPSFNIFHVGNFTSVIPSQGFNPVCISQKTNTCIYLRRILQGCQFKLTNYGVNVPNRHQPYNAQISGPVIHVNRPFYYGIWFKDENYETFVYFGAFLGL